MKLLHLSAREAGKVARGDWRFVVRERYTSHRATTWVARCPQAGSRTRAMVVARVELVDVVAVSHVRAKWLRGEHPWILTDPRALAAQDGHYCWIFAEHPLELDPPQPFTRTTGRDFADLPPNCANALVARGLRLWS